MAEKQKSRHRSTSPSLEGGSLDPLRDFQGGAVELFLARAALALRSNTRRSLSIAGGFLFMVALMIGLKIWNDIRIERSLKAYNELMDNPVMVPGAAKTEAAIAKLEEYRSQYSMDESNLRALQMEIQYLDSGKQYGEAALKSLEVADLVNDTDLKAYMQLKAATYFEMAREYKKAEDYFKLVFDTIKEPNEMKALSQFGEGRAIVLQGREDEGRAVIRSMMEMEGVGNMADLRLSAASFLLTLEKN